MQQRTGTVPWSAIGPSDIKGRQWLRADVRYVWADAVSAVGIPGTCDRMEVLLQVMVPPMLDGRCGWAQMASLRTPRSQWHAAAARLRSDPGAGGYSCSPQCRADGEGGKGTICDDESKLKASPIL
jgi:hypothetical protein